MIYIFHQPVRSGDKNFRGEGFVFWYKLIEILDINIDYNSMNHIDCTLYFLEHINIFINMIKYFGLKS